MREENTNNVIVKNHESIALAVGKSSPECEDGFIGDNLTYRITDKIVLVHVGGENFHYLPIPEIVENLAKEVEGNSPETLDDLAYTLHQTIKANDIRANYDLDEVIGGIAETVGMQIAEKYGEEIGSTANSTFMASFPQAFHEANDKALKEIHQKSLDDIRGLQIDENQRDALREIIEPLVNDAIGELASEAPLSGKFCSDFVDIVTNIVILDSVSKCKLILFGFGTLNKHPGYHILDITCIPALASLTVKETEREIKDHSDPEVISLSPGADLSFLTEGISSQINDYLRNAISDAITLTVPYRMLKHYGNIFDMKGVEKEELLNSLKTDCQEIHDEIFGTLPQQFRSLYGDSIFYGLSQFNPDQLASFANLCVNTIPIERICDKDISFCDPVEVLLVTRKNGIEKKTFSTIVSNHEAEDTVLDKVSPD